NGSHYVPEQNVAGSSSTKAKTTVENGATARIAGIGIGCADIIKNARVPLGESDSHSFTVCVSSSLDASSTFEIFTATGLTRLITRCPNQSPSMTASTPPNKLRNTYSRARNVLPPVKSNTSPSARLLKVVYAPKNPTLINKRRVGPIKKVASANTVTKASTSAPVMLMIKMS